MTEKTPAAGRGAPVGEERPRDSVSAAARVERWIRPEVRALHAYEVQESEGLIKLDTMENPYYWPESMVEAWLEALRGVRINRYPDPKSRRLTEQLRAQWQVPADMAMVLGNGSDELIQLLALVFRGPGRVMLAPGPTFVMYRLSALAAGMDYVEVPLDARRFELPRTALLAAVERHQPALVFIAYPNNPTGNLFDHALLEELLRAAPGVVVLDEAYAPFAEASFMHRLGAHPNLLVMRTLSKLGLAGLRLGALVGPRQWMDEIDKLRLPYNINVLTQTSAEFALRHAEVFAAQTARIRADRETLHRRLSALTGVTVWPSRANFLLLRVPAGSGGEVHARLRARGVLVKNLGGSHPHLADCLRVSVGLEEENEAFVEALGAAL